jgi:hypothetical protein
MTISGDGRFPDDRLGSAWEAPSVFSRSLCSNVTGPAPQSDDFNRPLVAGTAMRSRSFDTSVRALKFTPPVAVIVRTPLDGVLPGDVGGPNTFAALRIAHGRITPRPQTFKLGVSRGAFGRVKNFEMPFENRAQISKFRSRLFAPPHLLNLVLLRSLFRH